MADVGIKLKGNIDLIRGFTNLRQFARVKGAIRAAAIHIKGKIAEYPNATAANAPGPYPKRWYERGYGPKWALVGGGVSGRQTHTPSESLGRRWTTKQQDNGMSAAVGNNVSYGPFVQSEEHQASFHKSRGWITDQDVIDQEGAYVEKMIAHEIELALEEF